MRANCPLRDGDDAADTNLAFTRADIGSISLTLTQDTWHSRYIDQVAVLKNFPSVGARNDEICRIAV